MGEGYHFFHREGVRTSVRGKVETENHKFNLDSTPSEANPLWEVSVCLAHVPQLKSHGSWDHSFPLGSREPGTHHAQCLLA